MKKKYLPLLVIVSSLTFLSVPYFARLYGQGQPMEVNRVVVTQTPPSDQIADPIKQYKSTFPVVEYSDENVQEPKRRAKSKKYGKISVLDSGISEDSREVVHLDWEVGLPPLPVEKSQIIITGEVIDANAFLSDNKASVYSEFEIRVDTIFKNKSDIAIETGSSISAERQGGRVSFPSGFEKWFFVNGQGMPVIKRRYLFFLGHDFPGIGKQDKDLYIVTAYELRGKTIWPLDNPGGGTHPIVTRYKGKDTQTLLADLDDLLSKGSIKEGGRR